MARRPSFLASIVFLLGLGSVVVGQRLLESGAAAAGFTILGLLLALAAGGWRALRLRGATGGRRDVERSLLVLTGVGLCGLLLYFAQSGLMGRLLGRASRWRCRASPSSSRRCGRRPWPRAWCRSSSPSSPTPPWPAPR